MTHRRQFVLDLSVCALVVGAILIPSPAVAQCDEPDAPDCACFVNGGEWDAGGPGAYPFTVYIQDVAEDSLVLPGGTNPVRESCPCFEPDPTCDWDTHPSDPDRGFENGGKAYWQMVLGANSEALALWWAELMADDTVTMEFAGREAWCSETVSYWHRESAIPYLRGFLSDWWEHWRISNVGDLKLWYEIAEGSGGRGRWIDAAEIDYHDFEPGVNAPVPGAYIAVAEYDDVAKEFPNLDWSHSMIVDEMTVHRDGHGNVFQVEIEILEGNSGNRVRDDSPWDDLFTFTPQGSGWEAHFSGDDGIMNTPDDILRKVYGIGIDLDQFGQPYYDPARLHEEDHPGMLRAVLPSPVTTSDPGWDGYAVLLPSLIQYAAFAQQEGGSQLKSGIIPGGFQSLPDGNPQNALQIPETFVGTITVQLPGPHPLPIAGIELTWGPGSVPVGYSVAFYDDNDPQGTSAAVPDLSNHVPPGGLPTMVPVMLDEAMTNVVSVQLSFPDGSVPPGTVLSDVMIRFEGGPWEDASSEAQEVQRGVFVDVKPGSCPNSFNPRKNGVLPVAILGTFSFDVTTIDPASVMGAGTVAPLRWAWEDVATPYIGGSGGCHTMGPDGIIDLTLKYDAREVTQAMDLMSDGGELVPLLLHGTLMGTDTMIHGEDWLRVLGK